jgi:hypothetical protein
MRGAAGLFAASPGVAAAHSRSCRAAPRAARTRAPPLAGGGRPPPPVPRSGSGGSGGDDSGRPRRRLRPVHLAALAAAAFAATQAATAPPARTPTEEEATAAARATPVTIVIPALNEAKAIGATLRCVKALDPPPADVIVAVGPSTDATADMAAAAGAHVVRGGRGRVRHTPHVSHALFICLPRASRDVHAVGADERGRARRARAPPRALRRRPPASRIRRYRIITWCLCFCAARFAFCRRGGRRAALPARRHAAAARRAAVRAAGSRFTWRRRRWLRLFPRERPQDLVLPGTTQRCARLKPCIRFG